MCERPAVEQCLAAGDIEGALDRQVRGRPLPVVRPVDTWLMDLWGQMRSELCGSQPLEVLRMHCRAARLSKAAQLEVWQRCAEVDAVVADYQRATQGAG